jgi:two-component system sensor histidine kinase DesK
MNLSGLRRTPVEWIDLYTRQALLTMLWSGVLFLLVGATSGARVNTAAMAALVVIAVAMLGVGTWALRAVSDSWPGEHPAPTRPVLAMCVAGALGAGLAVSLPEDPRLAGLSMVWATMAWSLSGLRDRRHLGVLLLVLTGGVLATTRDAGLTMAAFGGALFVGLTVHLSLWMLEVVRRLERTRDTEAALAVAEERLRFSRDVHDVLGRHLSTIAVRAELAAALSRRGEPGAVDMMLEVRATAHDALREARELARGYRPSNLGQELDGARSLLAAAGIATRVDVDGLPASWHEPAAWVVREAVTNVLRHSTATAVEVTWRDGVLSVGNDGVTASAVSNGVGLLGLAERLAPLGAVVSTTLREGVWTLAVTMPVTRPAEALDSATTPAEARA